ncbi:MAG TPA: APC family permease [Anaerovoracaceae bacterium]|nr:APC family permease [Anaerovoracaceae bacterium]
MEKISSSAKVNTEHLGLKKRKLSVATIVFMIYCLCSGGAFGIEEMVSWAGPGLTLIMLMVLPFVWGIPLGLVACELGSARPQEGGYYKWVQEALGEFWGFQAGWWRTVSVYIDNTLYVILAAGYISMVWEVGSVGLFLIKAAIIFIFTYINLRGLSDIGVASTIFSVLVMVAFAMVAVVGFLNWNQNPFIPITAQGEIMGFAGLGFSDWIYYIGTGIAIGMWMYSGYESMSTVAGEVENPQVIPKATLISVPLIMATYILPTMAGIASVGQWDSWSTVGMESVGYITVLSQFLHPGFAMFMVVIAVISNISVYNTYIASGSRGFFCLAEDNLAPPFLVKVDKKHGIPYVSVVSVAIVNLILCNFAFNVVVVIDVFLFVSAYVLIYISAIILRKRIPDSERPFKIPGGYGFLCLVCIMPIIIAFLGFFINGTDYFIGGMIGIVSGPIFYFLWKRRYGGLARKNETLYPVNKKTGLALGDLYRMAIIFLWLGFMGAIASAFLPWFEGDWGNDYYYEVYGAEGLLDTFLFMIKIGTFVSFLVGIIMYIAAKKLEPKKERILV